MIAVSSAYMFCIHVQCRMLTVSMHRDGSSSAPPGERVLASDAQAWQPPPFLPSTGAVKTSSPRLLKKHCETDRDLAAMLARRRQACDLDSGFDYAAIPPAPGIPPPSSPQLVDRNNNSGAGGEREQRGIIDAQPHAHGQAFSFMPFGQAPPPEHNLPQHYTYLEPFPCKSQPADTDEEQHEAAHHSAHHDAGGNASAMQMAAVQAERQIQQRWAGVSAEVQKEREARLRAEAERDEARKEAERTVCLVTTITRVG